MSIQSGRGGVVWKTPDITADGLKMFACITMLIQDIGIVIVERGLIHLEQYTQAELSEAMAADSHLMMLAGIGSIMQLIGGLAVPVFVFLLVEGFLNTSSYKRYLMRIVLCALVSELPYDMAVNGKLADWSGQNGLVSMAVSLLMLYFLEMLKEKKGLQYAFGKGLIVLCAVLWVSLLRAQYGLCVVLLAAIFYLLYAKPVWKTFLGILVSLLYVTGPLSFYGIWCYTGERKDRIPKYVYYLFYPLHFLVLALLNQILCK